MITYKRICIEDFEIIDQENTRFKLNRGKEYITSEEINGKVHVFSRYWIWTPSNIFAGEIKFT